MIKAFEILCITHECNKRSEEIKEGYKLGNRTIKILGYVDDMVIIVDTENGL